MSAVRNRPRPPRITSRSDPAFAPRPASAGGSSRARSTRGVHIPTASRAPPPATAGLGDGQGDQDGYDRGWVADLLHGVLHRMTMRPGPLAPSIGYRAAVSPVRGRPQFAHLIRVLAARPDRAVWPSRTARRRGRSRRPRCARSTSGTPHRRLPSLAVSSASCPILSAGGGAAAGIPAHRGAEPGERARAEVMGVGVGQRSGAPDARRSALLRVRQRGGIRQW